ncbi:MAG: heterodisulfide reductase-related iron-sulfur binding cluster [candidate division WOR-3 bacterium]|nr:heterodisulfide reductase-related iron-sulfur binding cluster [candidate division WOR-3 bacterium]MCX7947665.1 heterodisulfide reductase-related iron-sulfur binding cluster [candidate division WOR-3 bacterium]MDW8150542.1 (Fe-S)-binding protein [candidate division WOR-3 bacterium]
MEEIARPLGWNVGKVDFFIMYALFLISLFFFLYGFYRHFKMWSLGKKLKLKVNSISYLVNAIFQRKVIDRPFGLFSHVPIFWSMIILTITTTLVAIQMDFGIKFIYGNFYLFLSFISDLAGVMLILGIAIAILKRVFFLPIYLRNILEDKVILFLLLLLAIQGFLIEALRISYFGRPDYEKFSFFGYLLSYIFYLDKESISFWHRILWNTHAWTTMLFIAYIPYSKLSHIFTSALNLIFYKERPTGKHDSSVNLIEIMNKENFSEEEIKTGYKYITDLPWNKLLMVDACTICGRCSSVCPAYITQKPLDPKKIVLDTKEHAYEYLENRENRILGVVVNEDALWSCTTCGACVHACPVGINQLDLIINYRRALVDESIYPSELNSSYRGMENQFNPWNAPKNERLKFAKELNLVILKENKDYSFDYLLWMGCAGVYDSKSQKTIKSLVSILSRAGIRFAVLGDEERCTGDSARRTGNELIFQTLAFENVNTFKKYNIKNIITICPHCYNTFKNEYSFFGIELNIYHHSEVIFSLIRDGRIKVKKSIEKIVYHDPCYLSRHNGIYQKPREVLDAIGNLLEVERSKLNTLCCGAGGGRMWMEEKFGKKINIERTEELLSKNPNTIAISCPFCNIMISDGVNRKNENVHVKDIAVLVEENLLP